MSIIKGLAFTAFVIAIPLFLIITNLRVVVNTPLLYSYGFDQYEIEAVTGIERDELHLGRQADPRLLQQRGALARRQSPNAR